MLQSAIDSKVKFLGCIKKLESGYELAVKNSSDALLDNAWKERVVVTDDGKIVKKDSTPGSSKLLSAVVLFTEETINQIISAYEDQLEYPHSFIEFSISTKNTLSVKSINPHYGTVNSYHKSSSNPKLARAKTNPRLLRYSDLQKNTKKKVHPRVKYLESSQLDKEHDLDLPVTLLRGDRLAKTLLLNHKNKSYKHALIDHIVHTLKIKKSSPIIYQSLCVPENDTVQLGLHGAGYIIKHPAFFLSELEALKELQKSHGYSQIRLTIPNIKNVEELQEIKKMLRRNGLTRSPHFNLLLNLQTPSSLFLLDEILSEGVDGVVFDFSKLGRLLLGMDTQIMDRSQKHFDHAIIKALRNSSALTTKKKVPLYVLLPEKENQEIYKEIPHHSNIHVIAHM